MKKANLILGVGVLAITLLSFKVNDNCEGNQSENLDIDEITYIEEEDTVELGFDTAQYLPEDFNAYKGMEFDLNSIIIAEEVEEIDLGFETAEYLPLGFNVYEGMVFDLDEIEYVELEEEIDLGYDVNKFLPNNFSVPSK